MERRIVKTAALFGASAIVLGAFGAHALKKMLTIEQLNTFDIGVKYQMYHALFLLFIGLSKEISDSAKKVIFNFVVAGIFSFSGSIYLLATNDLTAFDFRAIGFITPVGGLLLIIGWIYLFIDFLRKKS
jgi:uncharacterized membrane protein YgdD (TMEM256/DUF423 family)